ncbi:hypothetical protein M7I_3930 [Glarea lozoyensis 74030]|uniref:Uncharacterized protein n=1 Tax=Glarea lozoyensis (strain ATCC 74030 / MF5533) TaxID=1104152 RepID=H0EMT3_GLAL7|nr:hypothetical protein M7I_3930 [Glarea lozoyensis 74030]
MTSAIPQFLLPLNEPTKFNFSTEHFPLPRVEERYAAETYRPSPSRPIAKESLNGEEI